MPTRRAGPRLMAAAGLALAATAVLYAFGRTRAPDYAGSLFGRHGNDANLLTAQLGTGLLCLALYQLISALWMYRGLPGAGAAPRPVHLDHRIGGAALFALSLPIAYHCITAYEVRTDNARVAVHSVAGCCLYGAFAAKVLLVRSRRLPAWALPLAGGTLAGLIAILWSSAALWQFSSSAA
jgi:hypothetical protein